MIKDLLEIFFPLWRPITVKIVKTLGPYILFIKIFLIFVIKSFFYNIIKSTPCMLKNNSYELIYLIHFNFDFEVANEFYNMT